MKMPGNHAKHQQHRQQQAKILRSFRKIHRATGAALFVFFFIIGITGLLLGWKKNSGGYLLAHSRKGTTTNMSQWLSTDSLSHNATRYLHLHLGHHLSSEIDRIDIRPDKGMAKFVFKDHFNALQLDLSTGQLLHIEKRRADFIEKIHDGSIVDHYLGIPQGWFKLFYTSVMALALIVFTITGFWLWYGPKKMRP
jgi:uncharacterized iron-regulated membrane protein